MKLQIVYQANLLRKQEAKTTGYTFCFCFSLIMLTGQKEFISLLKI